MSNVQEVPSSLLTAMNGTKASAKKGTDGVDAAQDRFMTLLVTQMRNQDPLNPMDNAQVTSQMAQLSTVTGIDKLNATLESLKGAYAASQSLQAASMIGHGVLVDGNTLQLEDGKSVFGIDLPQAVDKVKVTIRDAAGTAVQYMNFDAQPAGILPLAWDGKTTTGATAKDGKYTFDIEAKAADEKVTAKTLSFGQVSSISTGGQGIKINVPGVGDMNLSDVRQIL